jgi:hypothetical protein
MKLQHPQHAKILNHSAGLGTPSPDMVRQRARELSVIDGREANAFTEADWEQAKAELHGGHLAEDEAAQCDTRSFDDHDGVVGSAGRHTPNVGATEEIENLGEELIHEGMEEAVHERMLEARKNGR